MQLVLGASPHVVQPGGLKLPLAPLDAALLAWLALEGPTPRTRLAQLLWPGSESEAARNTLRQRLFQLKRQFGHALVGGQATLALAEGVAHDLYEADDVLGHSPHEFGAEFGAWLEQQRERRRGRVRQSLVELAEMAERAHDHADALGHALELLALEPLAEDAHRRVIRLHYLRGDRAAALLAFDRCEQVLKDEVGAAPSAETLALLASVESQRNEPALHPRVLPVSLQRPPRIVGRERECAELAGAWAAGQPFLALGDAGIGKTRLLEALARQWTGALLVPARPGDAGVPLVLVGRLVDALCEHQPAWAGAPCVHTLRELLSSAPEPGGHANRRPSVRPSRQPLRELLVLGSCATPPVALLFDDLQFADDASVAALDDALAAPALAALRWGWASRTHGELAQPRIDALRRRGDICCVMLRPLELPAITELVDALQLGGADAPALASALQRHVGGNPMFLLEAVRRLVDQGRPLLATQVSAPRRVHELVDARLRDLTPGQRLLMRVAAIAGPDFDVALAEAVSRRDALDLADDWRALERLALFDEQGIAHDLYAEATLAELPAAIAKTLHARVAEQLQALGHDSARLAAHWLAAQEDQRAQPHLLAAAHKAWRAACPQETLSFFRHAAEIALSHGDADEAFDCWFDAADALSEIGSPAMLQRCAEALPPLARDEKQRVRTRLVQAVLLHVSGQTEAGMRAVRDLLSDAIALGDVRVEAECRFAIANRANADGEFDDAVHQLAAAERLMRASGDDRRAAALSSSMAMVLAQRGQPRRAIAEQRRLMPLLEQAGDQATWTVACALTALQHVYTGDAVGAVREARRALEVARQASIAPPDSQLVIRHLTEALNWAGRFELALSTWHELATRLAQQCSVTANGDAIGLLYLQMGRPDLAQPHLAAYLALPHERRREQLRRAWIDACMNRWATSRSTHAIWPADALRCEDLALAGRWGLLSGLAEATSWSADEIGTVAGRCDAEGVVLFGLPLRALQAREMLVAGATERGAALALRLVSAVTGRDLVAATPWAALYLAQALRLAGCADAALRVAQHGAAWVERTACNELPSEFRASFLQRNPVNRELLALAARLVV